MSKYTPGPWVIIPGGDEWSQGRIATIEPKPETMVETNYWTVAEVNIRRDEREANARLISAAPDLLEALEALERIKDIWLPLEAEEQHAEEMYVLHMAANKMLAAITKAKGK